MELFSLLAKLTLDKSEFESGIAEAENEVRGITIDEPELDLDDEPFQQTVDEAENAEVDDPESPELNLDNEPYKESLEDADQATEEFGGGILDTLDNIKGLIIAAGITTAIVGIVDYLGEAVDLARQTGDNIDKSSRAMSLSTDAYQEWSHVLSINGASITDLNRGLTNMRKLMGGGDVAKEAEEAFAKLGITTENVNENFASTEDLLDYVLKRLADFEGSAADRDLIAQAMFGRGGTKLNAMFDGTSSDIEYLKQQAHDLGLVMSEDAVAAAAEYNDAYSNMKDSIEALKVSIGETLLPVMTSLANQVSRVVSFLNPRTTKQSLTEKWLGETKELENTLTTIEETSTKAQALYNQLIAMGNPAEMTAEQYAIWKGTAESLIELVPSLGEVINTETGEITANSEEIKENIRQWENLAKQKALQELKEKRYHDIVMANQELIDKSIDANKKAANAEEARAESLEKVNAMLQKYGHEGLSDTATYQDYINARDEILNQNYGDEYMMAQISSDLAGVASEWAKAVGDANAANVEVTKLTEEIKKSEDEYKEWLETAEALYGVQFDEAKSAKDETEAYKKMLESLPRNIHTVLELEYETIQPRGYAIGSSYIPYDQLAYVHRGEEIRTATDVRRDNGNVSADLEDRIIDAIRTGMDGANVTAIVTDREVAKGTNRFNGKEIDSGRFRP